MDLTPEYIKRLPQNQLELLKELGELAKKEYDLTEQINMNRRQAEKVGLNRDRESANRLMDDHEFDNLISIQSTYEREQVRGKIRSVLDSLIVAGMGELGIIQRHVKNYGIDMSKYKK